MRSWIYNLDIGSIRSCADEWKMFPIKRCFAKNIEVTYLHASALKPGFKPHEPHIHSDEELIIIVSGKAQIITKQENGDLKYSEKLSRGAVVYHESGKPHTITPGGDEPAVYICLRWNSPGREKKENKDVLRNSIYLPDFSASEQVFKIDILFESHTEFLEKLHCHTSVMQPGAGYDSHRDDHDVIIFVLEGQVQTLNQTAGPDNIIFYRAEEEHGMRNIGSQPAKYIVFEFHNREKMSKKQLLWKLFKKFWE